MTATLASMITRVRDLLVDSGGKLWTDATVTEGIRQAVGEYSLAGDAVVTLNGLDNAVSTTIPATHESMIAWGASAYAALARAVDRADSAQLGGEAGALKGWGDQRLKEYKAMLGSVFPGYLVVLAGSGGSGGEDPAKLAAEVALLAAQADKTAAQAAAIESENSQQAAEPARLNELRTSANPPWETWNDGTALDGAGDISYPDGYDRN